MNDVLSFMGYVVCGFALGFLYDKMREIFRLARKVGYTWEFWFLLSTQSVAVALVVLFILDISGV